MFFLFFIYLFILLTLQNTFTVRGILQKEKCTTASYSGLLILLRSVLYM